MNYLLKNIADTLTKNKIRPSFQRIKVLEYKIDDLQKELENVRNDFKSFYYQNLQNEDLIKEEEENDFS